MCRCGILKKPEIKFVLVFSLNIYIIIINNVFHFLSETIIVFYVF